MTYLPGNKTQKMQKNLAEVGMLVMIEFSVIFLACKPLMMT